MRPNTSGGRAVARLLLAGALALRATAGLGEESGVHPRERLFGDGAAEVTAELSQRGARWILLFAPRLEACTPQDAEVVQALRRLEHDYPDLVVRTLVPEGLSARRIERGIFGEPFPGSLVEVPPGDWSRQDRVAPRPRIEVWSGRGELLLMRSLPPTVSQDALYDEVLWARSFTEPAETAQAAP